MSFRIHCAGGPGGLQRLLSQTTLGLPAQLSGGLWLGVCDGRTDNPGRVISGNPVQRPTAPDVLRVWRLGEPNKDPFPIAARALRLLDASLTAAADDAVGLITP